VVKLEAENYRLKIQVRADLTRGEGRGGPAER
jgi:hypothetical protein